MPGNNIGLDGLEFVDDTEQAYFAEAQLGQQVLDFLHSPTGRLLHGRANFVMEEAKEKLLEVDVSGKTGRREFQAIKDTVRQARWFKKWCAEAIHNGEAAAVLLEDYRD